MIRLALVALTLIVALPAAADPGGLAAAIANPLRSDANKARDVYRHPAETLGFFGVQPGSTVVEVWPGGGWYTEILAPYLRDRGIYYAAGFPATLTGQSENSLNGQRALADKLASNAVFDHVVLTELNAPARSTMAPPGTVDVVLTFRNVHNWVSRDNAAAMFQAFHRALKPGGVLGVVEHRAKPGTTLDVMKKSGYITEALVIELASNAGFTLADRSEINANSKDTTEHPKGVWTLPPNFAACADISAAADLEACKKPYTDIGESDRMTLKFVKAP